MYPQGTVARTPSTATASTSRPTRQSTQRNGPRHPYELYPQGVDDLDDEQTNSQSQVPVGFLGLGQSYQRQRGPEGEEPDFIGDYGHAEQLPPYSRYPEDGPEKVPLMSVPVPPVASHTRAPVLGTDPSMSLMHTSLQPSSPQSPQQQPQSMTDESSLARQTSHISRASVPLLNDPESSANSMGEKSWSSKSWREKRRTRICGVPFWCVLIIAGVLGLVAIIAGSVLGGYAEGKKSNHKYAILTTFDDVNS